MSDEVEIPFGDNPGETAVLLLAAAEELDGFDASAVRTTSGAFLVPQEIAERASQSEPEPPPKRRRRSSTTPEPGQEE